MSTTAYAANMSALENPTPSPLLWKEALGFINIELSVIYACVSEDRTLLSRKHNAMPDAKMMFYLMQVFYKAIFLKNKYAAAGIKSCSQPLKGSSMSLA